MTNLLYEEDTSWTWVNWHPSQRYDLNQTSAAPANLSDMFKSWSKMLWSTVSKAALRSSRTSAKTYYLSIIRSCENITETSAFFCSDTLHYLPFSSPSRESTLASEWLYALFGLCRYQVLAVLLPLLEDCIHDSHFLFLVLSSSPIKLSSFFQLSVYIRQGLWRRWWYDFFCSLFYNRVWICHRCWLALFFTPLPPPHCRSVKKSWGLGCARPEGEG